MKKYLILIPISLFLTSCATIDGIKKDSNNAWEVTKEKSKEVWTDTKNKSNELYEKSKEAIK